MGLSLLAPFALVIGALVALPLLAHLARQQPRERRAFGAMLLLERVVKRLRRRRRVKDPLLLLLRALAILALAFAMAGARWSYPGGVPEFGGTGRVVVIVDTSMSMSLRDEGSTLLQRARTDAQQLVDELPDGTLLAAVTYANGAERLVPALTTDHARVSARLAAIEPSAGRSDLRAALLEARRLLGGEPGEVVVFTDEAGSHMVGEARQELELLVQAGSAVIPRTTHADPPRNVAVVAATYGEGVEGGQVRLRVANYGPDVIEVACEVVLPDGAQIPVFVELPGAAAPPAGPTEVEERVTVPPEAKGGVGRARCEDPDLPLDDVRYFHLPRVGASRVLVIDGDPGDTPTRSEVYFLERALAPWGGTQAVVRPDVSTPVGLANLDPEKHRVVFLANVGDPRPWAPRLTDFVRRGGSLVITVGDNVTPDRYAAALGPVLPASFRKAADLAERGEAGMPLALPDTSLELFAPFARAGRAGFARVRSSRVMTFDPYVETDEVRTLMRYENGVPALVERKVGSGRVLVWTSSIDLGWSNLPLQAVFMPLVQRTVAWLGAESAGGEGRFEATVGERVSIALPDLTIEPDVIGPDGEPVRAQVDGSRLVFTPAVAGAYLVRVEGAPPLAWVAVNAPAEESDVRRYDSIAAVEQEIDPSLFLRHVDLGPYLLAAALGLMVVTGALSMRPGE